jgi:hypothetical protein
MYEPTTFTRNQIEVVGVNRDSPKRGVSYLVFRCCKQVISSRMKQPDAGTRPKARPGRTIASFGSTWQVGGKAYCAPTMKTTRISKRCAPSAHSERLRSFARSSRSLPVFQLGEDSWWRAASAGPGRGCFAGHERQGSYWGKDCSARTRRNQARGLSHHRLRHGLPGRKASLVSPPRCRHRTATLNATARSRIYRNEATIFRLRVAGPLQRVSSGSRYNGNT